MNVKQIVEYMNLFKPKHMYIDTNSIYDEDWDYGIRLYWDRRHGAKNILGFKTRMCKDSVNRFKWLDDIFILTETREINSFLVELTYSIQK